jgi:methyl-accepting chemotaxis protein
MAQPSVLFIRTLTFSERCCVPRNGTDMFAFLRSKKPDPALAQLQSRLGSLEANCLAALEQGLADMAAGNLTTAVEPVTRPIDLHSEDPQVAALVETFNAMLRRAQNALTAYNAHREELRAALGDRSSLQDLRLRLASLDEHCLTGLGAGLTAVAEGDLTRELSPATKPIEVAPGAFPGALTETFNSMLGRAQGGLAQFNVMREELRAALGDRSCLGDLTARLASLNDNCLTALQTGLIAVADGGDLSVASTPVTTPITARPGHEIGALAGTFNSMLGRAQASIEAYNGMRGDLADVARTAARIADGDLTASVAPKSEDDVLGNAFAEMSVKLRSIVAQVSDTAIGLRAASVEMARSSEETHRAIEEIAHAVADVAAGSERQLIVVGSAQEVAVNVVGVTSASEATAQDARTAAADARAAAEEGARAVTTATKAMAAVRESSAAISETMADLDAKSQQIGGIVEAITGIAEQTNLLALNAAIEAARAGDQGRGFAVVADEVRKLAEGSQQAAREIGTLVGSIQGETQRALNVVEAGAAQTEDGAATVEQAHAAFLRIDGSVGEVHDRVVQITDAVREISLSSAKVQGDLDDIVSVAQQSTAATEQVSASTQQTSASAQEIATGAQDLARRADSLADLVATFKVA